MLEFLRRQMAALLEKRDALQADRDSILEVVEREKRTAMTEAESAKYAEARAAIAKLDSEEISPLQERIASLEEDEKREAAANQLRAQYGQVAPAGPNGERRASVSVGAEPLTYNRGGEHSYFLDMARSQFRQDAAAAERLQRHAAELRVELPAREKRREEMARREMRGINDLPEQARESVFERRTNPNRTDGQGGYFVPPLWLVDQYIDLPRWGRPIANSVMNLTLPSGTDSVNLPKVSTGSTTAAQTADGAAVSSTDITDTYVSAGVKTVAGQQDVAMQLLDQSPTSFDQVVFTDLISDYNEQTDVYVINGSGSSGQYTGILNTSGINAITYTDASPTLPEMYVPWVKSISQIASNRKRPATVTFCIPSIWYSNAAQLDTTNRPLIITESEQPFNAMALQTGVAAEGPVGRLAVGTPVILDGNIPSNLGSGTDETRIITLRSNELYLWEGPLRTRVLTEVLSGTLQVRFQVWAYQAFMPNRLPASISVVSGTGMIPPAGY